MFSDVVIADAHFLEQEGMFSPYFEAREPGEPDHGNFFLASHLLTIQCDISIISSTFGSNSDGSVNILC